MAALRCRGSLILRLVQLVDVIFERNGVIAVGAVASVKRFAPIGLNSTNQLLILIRIAEQGFSG